jgi:hypothetical protein
VPLGKPVEISAIIRRMRGGSQSFLVRGSDGFCYVAKFADNPQGNRTLINECIASHLLSTLGVRAPEVATLHLTDSCQGRHQLYFSGEPRKPIANGLHFGSKCPVDPDAVAIFDFLPKELYTKVDNIYDIGIVFAFDQWSVHQAGRQFVFAREAKRTQNDSSLSAWAIDHGMCFGGQDWVLKPRSGYGYHPRINDIYSHFDFEESVLRGAQLIQSLPASELQAAHQRIPRDWFSAGDEIALDDMLATLEKRQNDFAASIHYHVAAVKELDRLTS